MIDLLILHPRMMMNLSSLLSNGPLTIASYLHSRGFGVRVIDDNSQYKQYSTNDYLEVVNRHNPLVVGIGINVLNAFHGYNLLRDIRSVKERTLIIGGGMHSYDSSLEMLSQGFDIVFKGEAELSLPKFLTLLRQYEKGRGGRVLLEDPLFRVELEKIPGLLYKANDQIKDTGNPSLLNDLDELPFLDHNLVNLSDYIRGEYDFNSVTNFMNFQRGCPFSCIYCKADFMGGKIRHNSPTYMFAQLQALYSQYGLKQYYLTDSNFPLDKNRMYEFCQLMVQSGLSREITLWCQTSVTIPLSSEDLEMLHDAGFTVISVGVERFDSSFRKYMNKAGTSDQALEIIKRINKSGIKTNINILINFPQDTLETLDMEAIHIEKALPYVDYYTVNYLVPLPGTMLFKGNSNSHRWYLNPDIVNKVTSYYDLAFNVTTPGVEFNLFNLSRKSLTGMRKFKEKYYSKSLLHSNRSTIFMLLFIVEMLLAKLSYVIYRISPKAEDRIFAPLKFIRKSWAKAFLVKQFHKRSGNH